jgi:hypothetical protein
MNNKVGGQRPRPRVALLGDFETEDAEQFLKIFPTIWQAMSIKVLEEKVDVREIDLLVIASGVGWAKDWPEKTHVICFSKDINDLPGPVSGTNIVLSGSAQTEEYYFPDVPLPISRRRDADYSELTNVRGWQRLGLKYSSITQGKLDTATDIFDNGAIICERSTNIPLAVYFLRKENNLGVCWFPMVDTNQADWVDLMVTQWAQSDKESFPNFGDWTNSPEWMVYEEEQISSRIDELKLKKSEVIAEIEKQIGELTTKYALAKLDANNGRRRLITAQGKDLVSEVNKCLKEIGFVVDDVDQTIDEKGLKREDIRLSYQDKEVPLWKAIVEVRGYSRSAGTTSDLLRLSRFAELFKQEFGQFPDKRIYIINGQLELLPAQRQEPLASAGEDVNIFAESGGILIWTLDLFRTLKTIKPTYYPALMESIKNAKGRWLPPTFNP